MEIGYFTIRVSLFSAFRIFASELMVKIVRINPFKLANNDLFQIIYIINVWIGYCCGSEVPFFKYIVMSLEITKIVFKKYNWQFTTKLKLKKTYKPKRTNIRSRLCFQKSWCLHCEVSPLYTILVTDKGFHRPKDENFIISYLCQ